MKDPIQYLLNIESRGIKMGLTRTKLLMDACGNPQNGLPVIQVAGTNGKGSVSAMLAGILKEGGYKTGLFTSPHLVEVNERIRINGTPISDTVMEQFIMDYKEAIDSLEASFFESITALAFWYFKKGKVDVAVMETGLGGRLDSVSVCEPVATVMTPISLDHMEILGESLMEIAIEKSGAMKQGIPCISAKQNKEVTEVLTSQAVKMESPIHFVNGEKKQSFTINLPGKIQKENALLAAETLIQIPNFTVSESIIHRGLQSVRWHGRNQIIKENPFIVFDVAHNLDSIMNFLQYYENLCIGGDSTLIIALQARKRIESAISKIESLFSKIICTQAGDRNPMPPEILADNFSAMRAVVKYSDPTNAIQHGLRSLSKEDGLAIIGSHCLGPAVSSIFKLSFASI
ncbi:MAG: folylpolyglutamate synthase/dihydrofolate synthase family protein [Candidatus Marinimicrobia bacterium]|nr:folylpolyglutamate synthase/dihydrofolate synthase family protein [Candidatus Neomarinimicrobiota bacterium]